jgi:fatty acid desaturase
MLTHDELTTLGRASDVQGALALALDWLAIAAIFALPVVFPHPLAWAVAIVLMARQQLALAILMHEAAHQRLFATRWLNETLGQLLTAAPIVFSMTLYRALHLKHHRIPLTDDDPDLSLIGGYPIDRGSFLRKLARDAAGISYFKFFAYFVRGARKLNQRKQEGEARGAPSTDRRLPFPLVAASIVVLHGALIAALAAAGHPELYLLWWIPLVTVLQLLLRIRGITEHAGYQPSADQRLCSRTVVSPLQTFFFAPHHVNYHIEHHVYPGVPFFQLPRVHALMAERGALPAANVYRSYLAVLRDLIAR